MSAGRGRPPSLAREVAEQIVTLRRRAPEVWGYGRLARRFATTTGTVRRELAKAAQGART